DWPVFIPVGGRTSYTGDVLALVVAEDKATARRAAELVEVGYRPLPPIVDPVAAIAEGAHGGAWGAVRCRPPPTAPRPRCGGSTATSCPARPTPGATSTKRSQPAPTRSTRCSPP